eukprot:jgi/Picsp_1/1753/NSC_05225-R1_---NA---
MALFSKILFFFAVLFAVASVTLAGVATPISGTASTAGVTGTTSNAKGALADALADSIRIKAEARKALQHKPEESQRCKLELELQHLQKRIQHGKRAFGTQ